MGIKEVNPTMRVLSALLLITFCFKTATSRSLELRPLIDRQDQECVDIKSAKFCEGKRGKGKCESVKNECKKTCGLCLTTPSPTTPTTKEPTNPTTPVTTCEDTEKQKVCNNAVKNG